METQNYKFVEYDSSNKESKFARKKIVCYRQSNSKR